MAGLAYSPKNCIKNGYYSIERPEAGEGMVMPEKKPTGPILKWYQVKMTYEEKARFNLLTYYEYCEWMEELRKAEEEKSTAKTFWGNDTELRSNVSSDEYEDFLSKNNIDVSNRTAIDFDALVNEVNGGNSEPQAEAASEPAPAEEQSMEEILASINAANSSGQDKILTEAEIAALFAAAGV